MPTPKELQFKVMTDLNLLGCLSEEELFNGSSYDRSGRWFREVRTPRAVTIPAGTLAPIARYNLITDNGEVVGFKWKARSSIDTTKVAVFWTFRAAIFWLDLTKDEHDARKRREGSQYFVTDDDDEDEEIDEYLS